MTAACFLIDTKNKVDTKLTDVILCQMLDKQSIAPSCINFRRRPPP